MIVTSTLLPKKTECRKSMTTILMRTDGFQNVFKGLTYKQTFNIGKQQQSHFGSHTSMDKRPRMSKQINLKDSDSHFEECEDKIQSSNKPQTEEHTRDNM